MSKDLHRFRRALPLHPLHEVASRVVVEFPNRDMYVVGTAAMIAGHMAITARHVLEAIIVQFGEPVSKISDESKVMYSVLLYQVLPGRHIHIWEVCTGWSPWSDIAILHLNLKSSSDRGNAYRCRTLRLRLNPPKTGEKVLAFGYRRAGARAWAEDGGRIFLRLVDLPTVSRGEVGQVFPQRRDSSMLNFPCFELIARVAPGMSGGLVVDENGSLCGLVCSGFDLLNSDLPPISYAVPLWPMLTTVISADRGPSRPAGDYPMIDLILDGTISSSGVEELDGRLFPGRDLLAPIPDLDA